MAGQAVRSSPMGWSRRSYTEDESLGDLLNAARMDAIGAYQQAFDLVAKLTPDGF